MESKVAEIINAAVSPVSKLIDAISKGIGTLYEPHKIKKLAEAEAYKIKTIGQALVENSSLPMEYVDNSIKADTRNYEELEKRAVKRFAHTELLHEYNIESIADKAYDSLKDYKEVTNNEEVSLDWITRFISYAQNISDTKMQELWAKILAGEVINPNSFSFKTLEILNNMTQNDARIFYKICWLTIDKMFVPNEIYLLEKYGITYDNILEMDELGLINSSATIGKIFENTNKKTKIFETNHFLCLSNHSGRFSLQIFKLTTYAIQLLKIINYEENDDFILNYAKLIKNKFKNIGVTLHKINGIEGSIIKCDDKDLLV